MFYLTSSSSERNLSSEKKVLSVLSIFHSKRPRKFWGFIFSKTFFLQYSLEFERNFSEFLSKFSNEIVKKAFYVSRGTLWKKHYVDSVKQFGTLGDKRFDLRRKICSTVVKSSLFVSRWAIGRIVLKEILLFLIWFFSDVQGTFFGFFVESFLEWSSKLLFSSQAEHIQ